MPNAECITKSPGFQSQFNCEVNKVHTEFVVQRFANRWMVLITQYERLPNLYSVHFDLKGAEEAKPAALNVKEFHISIPITMKCSLGADKAEVRAGIQFLVNKTKLGKCPTEILICLGLKQISGDVLKAIAAVLDKLL